MTVHSHDSPATPPGPPVRSIAARLVLLAMMATLLGGGSMFAQARRGPGGMMRGAPGVQREVFPPELVMRFQSEIGLSSEQEKVLIEEMQGLQSDLVPLQFEMGQASGELREALAGSRIDEKEALALAGRLMSLETQIKQRHLELMIRIKNVLTPEQQQQLRDLRDDLREPRDDGGRRPGRPDGRPGGPRP